MAERESVVEEFYSHRGMHLVFCGRGKPNGVVYGHDFHDPLVLLMDSTPVSLLEHLRHPGQSAAWGRFVHLYTPVLVRCVRQLRVPEEQQEDLIQDVFVTIVRTIATFRYDPEKSFRAWLFTVVANKWREQLRRRGPLLPDQPNWVHNHADPLDPIAAVDDAEYRSVLVAQAAELIRAEFPPHAWTAFWETTAVGRPPAEVAIELGVTRNAVYLARSRVLFRLRAELAGLFD